ncbi:hypothetical protein ACPZ19_38975 [Amycolatopsis lurida]
MAHVTRTRLKRHVVDHRYTGTIPAIGVQVLSPRKFMQTNRLMKEAKRLGVQVDELSTEQAAAALYRRVDPEVFGLVPDRLVTEQPWVRPELASALAAVRVGRWEPVAELLAGHGTDWNRRAEDVETVAGAAVQTDTEWIRRWAKACPGHADLLAFRAVLLIRQAWTARGAGWARDTSREQFAGFHGLLVEARLAAYEACEAAPADPTPWWSLITMARGFSVGHEEFRALWAELQQRAPLHRYGHDQALQYWCAKWSGSAEHMFAFAEQAASTHPSLVPLRLIAAYERAAHDESVWSQSSTAEAVAATGAWLDGDGGRGDGLQVLHDRGMLAYALFRMRRWNDAIDQFRHLGAHADAWVWEGERLQFLLARWETCTRARKPR